MRFQTFKPRGALRYGHHSPHVRRRSRPARRAPPFWHPQLSSVRAGLARIGGLGLLRTRSTRHQRRAGSRAGLILGPTFQPTQPRPRPPGPVRPSPTDHIAENTRVLIVLDKFVADRRPGLLSDSADEGSTGAGGPTGVWRFRIAVGWAIPSARGSSAWRCTPLRLVPNALVGIPFRAENRCLASTTGPTGPTGPSSTYFRTRVRKFLVGDHLPVCVRISPAACRRCTTARSSRWCPG
jgi:hypothetical protein